MSGIQTAKATSNKEYRKLYHPSSAISIKPWRTLKSNTKSL